MPNYLHYTVFYILFLRKKILRLISKLWLIMFYLHDEFLRWRPRDQHNRNSGVSAENSDVLSLEIW